MDNPIPYLPQQAAPIQPLLDPNLSQWILSPYDILDTLKHTFRGEALVTKEDKKLGRVEVWEAQQGVSPVMNEDGINYIYVELLTFVNRNSTLSHVEDDEIQKLGVETCNDIAEHLGKNSKVYELDQNMYRSVNRIVVNFVYLTLKRAWKGGERDFFKNTTSRQETVVQEKSGGKSWFPLPFGGR
jgi:hypothetical protein